MQVLSDELLVDNLYENPDTAKDLKKLTILNDNKNKAAPYLSSSASQNHDDAPKTRSVSCQTYSTGDILSAVTIDDD